MEILCVNILPRTPLAMLSAQFGDIGNSLRKRRKKGSSCLFSSSLSLNPSTLSGNKSIATSLPTALAKQ